MRSFLAVASVVVGALVPGLAWAAPAMPRPLEQKVEEADLVIVATLRTQPAHAGDPFDVAVVEVLKGRTASRVLRARASYFFTGCVPPPEGTPPPAALERGDGRFVLFLGPDEREGRQSRDPLSLEPGATVSAWVFDRRPAALAPAAIRALAALDAEPDDAAACKAWLAGLEGADPLLATALLHRVEIAASGVERARGDLGPRLAPRARAQFERCRPALMRALARLCASGDESIRRCAMRTATACLSPKPDAEPAVLADLARAGTAALSLDGITRGDAARLLAALRDPSFAARVIAVLETRPLPADADLLPCVGRAFVQAYPEREEELLAALVALLDDPASESQAIQWLSVQTGVTRGNADVWRAWWKQRARK